MKPKFWPKFADKNELKIQLKGILPKLTDWWRMKWMPKFAQNYQNTPTNVGMMGLEPNNSYVTYLCVADKGDISTVDTLDNS